MVRKTTKELFFYVLVGVAGAVIDALVFYFLVSWSFSLVMAQWLAALGGATHNHLWHHYRVFDHDQDFKKTYVLTLILATSLVLASGPFLHWVNSMVAHVWLSKVITLGVTALVSFIMRKRFIFIKSGEKVAIEVEVENELA